MNKSIVRDTSILNAGQYFGKAFGITSYTCTCSLYNVYKYCIVVVKMLHRRSRNELRTIISVFDTSFHAVYSNLRNQREIAAQSICKVDGNLHNYQEFTARKRQVYIRHSCWELFSRVEKSRLTQHYQDVASSNRCKKIAFDGVFI
jgi:hypothetical protein